MDSIIWLFTHKLRFPAHDYFKTSSVCLNGHFPNFPNSSNLPHPCTYGSIGVFLSVRLGVSHFSLSGVCGSGKTMTFCIIGQLKHSCRDWYLVLDIPGYLLRGYEKRAAPKKELRHFLACESFYFSNSFANSTTSFDGLPSCHTCFRHTVFRNAVLLCSEPETVAKKHAGARHRQMQTAEARFPCLE